MTERTVTDLMYEIRNNLDGIVHSSLIAHERLMEAENELNRIASFKVVIGNLLTRIEKETAK